MVSANANARDEIASHRSLAAAPSALPTQPSMLAMMMMAAPMLTADASSAHIASRAVYGSLASSSTAPPPPAAALPLVSTAPPAPAPAPAPVRSADLSVTISTRQQQQQRQPPSLPPPTNSNLDEQWQALKARKWTRGKDLTAFVQDLALHSGKRALVATSGGSYKKFVCSSATPCPWLLNAVCSRPLKRARPSSSSSSSTETEGRVASDNTQVTTGTTPTVTTKATDDPDRCERFWYITSGHLAHENCTSAAKPTARQLKRNAVLQAAVQDDARVSSAVLVERLRAHAQVECSKSMVYKAKTELLDALAKASSGGAATGSACSGALDSDDPDLGDALQRLPSYLAHMRALNPHVLSLVERDERGGFLRALLAMDPTGVWNDQSVLGVDSIEVAHKRYNGTALVLVGRDGNLCAITHAVAVVPDESAAHCAWFLEQLIVHGFPLRRFPLFTNGRAGFADACAAQQIPHAMRCTEHVLAEMRSELRRTGAPLAPDDEVLVWQAQQAETANAYAAVLRVLAQRNASAAAHLEALDPKRWAVFPYLALRKLYGWQTTQLQSVDTGAGMGLAPQREAPLAFFQAMALVLMHATFTRHELAVQWEREHRVVTPGAGRMMHDELARVPLYSVAMSTSQSAIVWNARASQRLQRRVDLQHRTCTCAFRLQTGVPCRHILAVLQKTAPHRLHDALEYFDECYLVRNYVASFKGRYLELPLDDAIERDVTLLPPRLVAKAQSSSSSSGSGIGNETTHDSSSSSVSSSQDSSSSVSQHVPPLKKRRVRTRPLHERKRGIYKCHKCHRADGHNRGTCPYQTVAVGGTVEAVGVRAGAGVEAVAGSVALQTPASSQSP